MPPPYTNFGPLDFVFTEFNHDFGEDNGSLINTQDLSNFEALFKGYFGAAVIVDLNAPNDVSRHTEPLDTAMTDGHWDAWYTETTSFFGFNTKLNDEQLVQQIFYGFDKSTLRTWWDPDSRQNNGDPMHVFIKGLFDEAAARAHWTGAQTLAPGGGFGFNVAQDPFIGDVLPPAVTTQQGFHYCMNDWVRGSFRCWSIDQVDAGLVQYAFHGLPDIYIVSDAASQCARKIWESATNDINVHCMYSSSTYGDPQSNAHPWDPTHNSPVRGGSIRYDWICQTPLSKRADDSMTLMKTTIEHRGSGAAPLYRVPYVDVDSRLIHKTIRREGTVVTPATPGIDPLDYPNAKAATTKAAANGAVTAELGLQAGRSLRKLWLAQGKRFGDHEQVIFAKMLQYANWRGPQTWRVISTPSPGVTVPPNPVLGSDATNTFLATGDWPCFCYAVYNRINAILIVHGEWYIFRFP